MIDAERSRHKGPIIDTAGLSKVLEGMDIPQLSSWFLSEKTGSYGESAVVCRASGME